MKRFLLFSLMSFFASWSIIAQTATPPAFGNGTVSNPYQIATLDNLYWIGATDALVATPSRAVRFSAYYIQTADIDASATSGWPSGGWFPIGDYWVNMAPDIHVFSGSYDGQNHTISGLHITNSSSAAFGLFGTAIEATIINLGIIDVDISGVAGPAGALVGYANGVAIDNCYSTGSVAGTNNVGGLAGNHSTNSTMLNCYSTCSVTGTGSIGGLIGSNTSNSTVTYSYHNIGTVNGSGSSMSMAGGLVGANVGASISKCYSTGPVSGYDDTGGLVGYNYSSATISDSYSRCICSSHPTFGSSSGGLVGYNYVNSSIINCYSTGMVSALMGGLVGYQSDGATTVSSFWDTQTSEKTYSSGGTGKTTEEMQTQTTFTDWDFINIWGINAGINDGYPNLQAHAPTCTNATIALTSGSNTPTVCANTAITPIVCTVSGGATGAGVSGLPEGVTGNYSGGTFTISGTPTVAGTYPFTVTTSGTASPCTEATATGTITVKPSPVATAPSVGDGSSGNPYRIASLENLYWIATTPDAWWGKYFIQTVDIDASATAVWCTGGWLPIGYDLNNPLQMFSGNYNGQEHTITGLHIADISSYLSYGLFGSISGATVQNLGVINIDINNVNGEAGAIAGYAVGATINHCYSSGTISVNNSGSYAFDAGGLVGAQFLNSTISNSYSSCNIRANNYAGGLVGYNYHSSVLNSYYVTGTVTGDGNDSYTGGLVGYNNDYSSIYKCHSAGTVVGYDQTGGLVGMNSYNSSVSDCYSRSNCTFNVEYPIYGGGLVGGNIDQSTITNCYSTGYVGTKGGGLMGYQISASVLNSFWDTESSGTTWSYQGTGKTTAEMKTQSTFTDAGWDFTTIWGINPANNDGYPNFMPESVCTNGTIALTSGSDNQPVCAGAAITNIVYTVSGGATGAGVSGLPDGVTGNYSGGTITISGTPTVAGTYPFTVTTTGTASPCTEATATGTITVNASITPSVTITSSDADNTICDGTLVTFTATPHDLNGGTVAYAWVEYNPDGLSALVGSNQNTYSTSFLEDGKMIICAITVTGGTCLTSAKAISNEIITTVIPDPSVTIASDISGDDDINICGGTSVTFTATPHYLNGGTAEYMWVKYYNDEYTTVGLAQNTYSSSSLENGAGIICVITETGGACPLTNQTGSNMITVTVNSVPDAPAAYAQSFCSSDSHSVNDLDASGNEGAILNWYDAEEGGTPLEGTTVLTSKTYYVSQTVGNCESAKTSVGITVNALPIVSITGETTIFEGKTTTLSPPSGGTWTSNNEAVATVTDAGIVTGVAGGTATFTFTDALTGCSATTGIVTVNACTNGSITLTSGSNTQTLCANTAITPIVYTVGGGATGAEVSGLPEGVTGNYENSTFTISGTPTVAVAYPYTVTTTGTASPCTESTTTGTITVNPLPTASIIGGSQYACESTLLTAATDAVNPIFSWLQDGVLNPFEEGPSLVVTQPGSYRIKVFEMLTSCVTASYEFIVAEVSQMPLDRVVAAVASAVCPGEETDIRISESESDVFYQLRDDDGDISIGSPQLGNGGDLLLPTEAMKVAATFNVLATRGLCSVEMPDKPSVTMLDNTEPVITAVMADPPVICSGSTTTLTVTGTLGGATAWKWYSGICGGILAGTGTSITVSPTETTDYYVRGEGGCITPFDCGPVIVTVETPAVAGTLVKSPDVIKVCEGTDVYATLTPGSGGNGIDELEFQTKTGAIWSEWAAYTSGTPIPTTGLSGVGVRTRHGADVCDPSVYNIVSWAVEATPVAGTLKQYPQLSMVCETWNVMASLTAGSGGNGTDQLEFRTKTGESWSDWTAYASGTLIVTTGKSVVEVRTRRMADVCDPSKYNTVRWQVEATPVPQIIYKYPDLETVCEGTGVSAITNNSEPVIFMDFMEYRTQNGSSWSDWVRYTPDDVIYSTGKSGVEIRAKRWGTACKTDWVYASWVVVAQPVSGTIIKSPYIETICEGTEVSATFTEGSGGVNCTDTHKYRYDGTGEWTEYTPSAILSTTGHLLVEIRTQRGGCQEGCNTDTRTVSWAVEATPVAGILSKTPDMETVCKGTEVSAVLTPGSGGDGTDLLVFRTNSGAGWSEFRPYLSGAGIGTTGIIAVEIWTRRWADYCSPSPAINVSWTVADDQDPVLPGNESAIVECLSDATAPEIPVATDNCDGTVSGVLAGITDNPDPVTCQGTRIYKYSYTDVAGNVSYRTFTYDIVRTTPPAEAGTPVAVSKTVECNAAAVPPALPLVKDVCGLALDAPIPLVTDNYDQLTCSGTRDYKYTYTDCAGLTFTWVFTYTIEDRTPPVMACKNPTVMLGLDGKASIVVADVNNGSADKCGGTVNLELNQTSFTCADWPSATVSLKGTDCAGNSAVCNATVNVNLRPTSLVYSGGSSIAYSDQVALKATLKDVTTNAPIPGKTIMFTIGSQTATAVTDALGVAATTLDITQAPGNYTVVTTFAGDCPFAAGTETDNLIILPENTCVDYTGQLYLNTSGTGVSTATLVLTWAVSEEPDGNPGEMNASTIGLTTKIDSPEGGTASLVGSPVFDVANLLFTQTINVNVTSGAAMNFTLNWTTGGYYINTCDQDAIITVAIPGNDFAAGGGNIILTNKNTTPPSAVSKAGTPGTKNNFGFTIKWARNYSKLTGSFNTIWRQNGMVWQAKSNSAGALIVTKIASDPLRFKAQITYTNVNVRQLDCDVCVPAMGNSTVIMTVYDWGETEASGALSKSDQIGFLVKDNKGKLIFSTNYYSTAQKPDPTLVQNLNAGNIQVKSSALKIADVSDVQALKQIITPVTSELMVYPNPFSERVTFEFLPKVNVNARIDMYDLTGRLVETIFNNPVEAGLIYNAEFRPKVTVNSVFLYRVTLGKEIFNGKVIYKK